MSDKDQIQRDIEAKKRKLEELKAKRLSRLAASTGSFSAKPETSSPSPSPTPSESPLNLLSQVDSLIKSNVPEEASPPPLSPSSAASLASPSGSLSPSAASPQGFGSPASSPRPLALSVQALSPISISPEEKIQYDTAVQTEESSLESQESKEDNLLFNEEDVRSERDVLRKREIELMNAIKQLEEEKKKKEQEEEEKKSKVLSLKEKEVIEHSQEFQESFQRSSLIMERYLFSSSSKKGDSLYDFTVNYDEEEGNEGTKQNENLRQLLCLQAEQKTFSRPVSSMDWNPKFPELLLCSYANMEEETGGMEGAASAAAHLDAQGSLLLWNSHLPSRPEYSYYTDSSILSAFFHPLHPRLIISATSSGQLLLFDTRTKGIPVNRTSLSNSHTFPIYSTFLSPLVNGLYNIVSVSTDGHCCVWNENNWHAPQHEVYLRTSAATTVSGGGGITTGLGLSGLSQAASGTKKLSSSSSAKEEMTITSIDFAAKDLNTMISGTDEGNLHKARIYEDKDNIVETIPNAHDGPITAVRFQPSSASSFAPPHLSSQFYLTSSFDWTVKLWFNGFSRPLSIFESARDYVFDVQWHPANPSLFAMGDGTGKIDLFDLNKDWDIPVQSTQVGGLTTSAASASSTDSSDASDSSSSYSSGSAISKLKWNNNGSILAAGTSNGSVYLYELSESLQSSSRDEQAKLWDTLGKKATGN